jgi:hypothetical protein
MYAKKKGTLKTKKHLATTTHLKCQDAVMSCCGTAATPRAWCVAMTMSTAHQAMPAMPPERVPSRCVQQVNSCFWILFFWHESPSAGRGSF